MWFVKYVRNAIRLKNYKALIYIGALFLGSVGIFGTYWYLFSRSVTAYFYSFLLGLVLLFILSSPLGEKLFLHCFVGPKSNEDEVTLISSLNRVRDVAQQSCPGICSNVKLHCANIPDRVDCFPLGENTVVVYSGIRLLDECAIDGAMAMSLLSNLAGGGLGFVVSVAASALILLPIVLWDISVCFWNYLFRNGLLGKLVSFIHQIDCILLQQTIGKLLLFISTKSVVGGEVDASVREAFERYGMHMDMYESIISDSSDFDESEE